MNQNVTPEPIFQILSGYMASQILFVANEIGLFEQLGEGPKTLAELAQAAGTPARPTRIVADALVGLGLLARQQDYYQNSPVTAAFLSGRSQADLRPILRLNHKIQYGALGHLEEAVRANRPATFTPGPDDQQIYSAGIEAVTMGTAIALAASYDFGQHRRLLDLGGGLGAFLRPIQRHSPDLGMTLFEQPPVAAQARERLEGAGVQIVAGDFFQDPLPGGHDVVLLANIVHNFPAEQNLDLLQKVRAVVEPGGRLLLVDFWLDETQSQPVFGALLSAMLFVFSGGENYSVEQGRRWLAETGWREVAYQPLGGPASLLIAES